MKHLIFLAAALVILFVFWSQTQNKAGSAKNEPVTKPPTENYSARTKPSQIEKKTGRDVAATPKDNTKNAVSGAIESEQEFERRYPGKWRFRKRSNQSIQTITGGLIPGVGINTKSALKFANEISPLLADGRFELASEAREVASSERLKSFQVDQLAEGYKVYQGSMQIISRAEDGAAYIVNNQLKDIQPFNTQPALTADQALALVQKKYAGATLRAPDSPQVFSTSDIGTRLAWVIGLSIRTPTASSREVVVSADTGEIIYEEEFVIHD